MDYVFGRCLSRPALLFLNLGTSLKKVIPSEPQLHFRMTVMFCVVLTGRLEEVGGCRSGFYVVDPADFEGLFICIILCDNKHMVIFMGLPLLQKDILQTIDLFKRHDEVIVLGDINSNWLDWLPLMCCYRKPHIENQWSSQIRSSVLISVRLETWREISIRFL